MPTISVTLTPYPNNRAILRVAPHGRISGDISPADARKVEEVDCIELTDDEGLDTLRRFLRDRRAVDIAFDAGDEVETRINANYFLRF